MKKYVLTASVVLTLAGCTASLAIADTQVASMAPSSAVKEIKVSKDKSFSTKTLIKEAKIKRNTVKMQKVIKALKFYTGATGWQNRVQYVFSGSSPRGWDCSGMVKWTYKQFGLELPHSANKQGHIGNRVSKPKVGDIVVMAYAGSTDFYHSAIYIGDGKIVHANQARGATVIEPLTSYKRSQIRFVRLVPTA
jgi:cell wall-associated NlpC family hydrolase